MIAIVDYGMGNLGSIQNMLSKLGARSVITSDLDEIDAADKLILPGVGAFDKAVTNLTTLGMVPLLNEKVLERKTPILGICLGMQLMTERSDEGQLEGLGWIEAEAKRFRFDADNSDLRVPHMGWNTIDVQHASPILDERYENSRFYFVHSYYVRCRHEENVLAKTSYGVRFDSAIIRDNIVGTQFHPEKSHKFGLLLLKNFAEMEAWSKSA